VLKASNFQRIWADCYHARPISSIAVKGTKLIIGYDDGVIHQYKKENSKNFVSTPTFYHKKKLAPSIKEPDLKSIRSLKLTNDS
jgi:hypothetical protein